ncbi:glycoside hydrolase [Altererythrobacter halimionae]|uniref:Glycoside hydrolase n=1 Tax=Alteriqipengyuania halimionae TaxID=1926630 RepID=A0A6I4U1T8_9SPHN|nr:glycoside hydrolase [Alteriqipengyuania halimionae]
MNADPFYTRYVPAAGIPVVSSDRVSDETLFAARDMMASILAYRPELAEWLAANDYRVAIMAEDEAITDLPEYRGWKKPAPDDPRLTRCERKHYEARIGLLSDRDYWNARVRGLGGKRAVAAEEDVLGRRSSRYWGETILVHEFAHAIHDAIRGTDPALAARIDAAYKAALADRLWYQEYATTTVEEYFAEGTQFWFNSNRLAVMDGTRVLNHDDLRAYDPRLYAVLAEVYGDNHRVESDPFYMSDARVPPGPIPENTAEVC